MKKIFLFILLLALIVYKYSIIDSEKKQTSKQLIPKNLQGFTSEEIKGIYYYLCVERWNTGASTGTRDFTDFNKVAEELNIKVSILKEIEEYYEYGVLPALDESIKNRFKDHRHLVMDYYSSIEPTAYCGLNTLIGSIVVYGQKRNTDFKKEATTIAENLIQELPGWVTGYKLTFTTYKDENLETEGEVDIGFLWKKGSEIKILNSSRGLYGYEDPEYNNNWHTAEWNDLKKIDYPNLD